MFYLVITGFILIVDTYAFQAVKSATRELAAPFRHSIRFLYWSFTALTIGVFTLALVFQFQDWSPGVRAFLFSTIMLVYIARLFTIPFLLAEDIYRIVSWIAGLFHSSQGTATGQSLITRSQFIGQVAMVAGGIPLILGLHGMMRNAYNYRIYRTRLVLPHLPDAFNGLKIVQLSDIHTGSFVSHAQVERGVRMVMDENPDLVFFTGDLVNYYADEALGFIDIFKQIKAKEGVYSIFGNHDYGDYIRYGSERERIRRKAEYKKQMIDIHHRMGWDVLLNENRLLRKGNQSLAIIGSENWSANGRFHTYGDMQKAVKGSESADFKILLSHDPTHWRGEVLSKYPDIDLTLSGHTHGGQFGIEIPGYIRWSPSQYIYREWAGLYKEGRQYLYVNRGFGFLGFHGRVGILPEITVIELVKA
ncbi:MAG: phosphoesterase [Chitinophagales bacterium]|nr:MAG: phosphoesterase [Chitinophagales bacterium]